MLNNKTTDHGAIPIWGGFECTVNRVGDRFQDQFEHSGHLHRRSDLDRYASLGIQALRFPVLWERVAPTDLTDCEWTYSDDGLARLRELHVEPIVGLVHHGSGPEHTDLLDPEFPEKLAAYARIVAERYPWVEAYTPVNEPLTTARFSAMYGHWYPHTTDVKSFGLALLNEVRATVLAMREIRRVNPNARLVQTDDLGKTHSTPGLAYQARFENERRWLGWDLLCGRLKPQDRMWRWLVKNGIDPALLRWHVDNPCPPDVLGVNHYISSERFLDERVELHKPEDVGGNRRHRYADVLAARVRAEGCDGLEGVLTEAWDRYGIPIAVTECHMGCTREEQLRWLAQSWEAAHRVRERGAQIVGLTVWSLDGAFDWDKLLTEWKGSYEPGVFDLRAPEPRPTALAAMVNSLAKGEMPDHPALDSEGWWARSSRFEHSPVVTGAPRPEPRRTRQREILIAGGSSPLGQALGRECDVRGLAYRSLTQVDVDLSDPLAVARLFAETKPWAVMNAFDYGRLDEAEGDAMGCYRDNIAVAAILATGTRNIGARFVTFSSDMVFGGEKQGPYVEGDEVNPLNVYGRSKREAERCVGKILEDVLIIRTGPLFTPWEGNDFVQRVLAAIRSDRPFFAPYDLSMSPTYLPDLAVATLDMLIDGECGVLHLANQGATSWAKFARLAATAAGLEDCMVEGRHSATMGFRAPRPENVALRSERAWVMPSVTSALAKYMEKMSESSKLSAHFSWR